MICPACRDGVPRKHDRDHTHFPNNTMIPPETRVYPVEGTWIV